VSLQVSDKNTREPVVKVWGSEEWITNNDKYCGKLLAVNKGWQSSLHFHPVKHETFLALVGCVWLEYIPDSTTAFPYGTTTERVLLRGWARDAVEIPPRTPHRFKAEIEDALVVEFSTTHSEEDVVRLEESRETEGVWEDGKSN
jgi:D-lyxose ketol-isomerase